MVASQLFLSKSHQTLPFKSLNLPFKHLPCPLHNIPNSQLLNKEHTYIHKHIISVCIIIISTFHMLNNPLDKTQNRTLPWSSTLYRWSPYSTTKFNPSSSTILLRNHTSIWILLNAVYIVRGIYRRPVTISPHELLELLIGVLLLAIILLPITLLAVVLLLLRLLRRPDREDVRRRPVLAQPAHHNHRVDVSDHCQLPLLHVHGNRINPCKTSQQLFAIQQQAS